MGSNGVAPLGVNPSFRPEHYGHERQARINPGQTQQVTKKDVSLRSRGDQRGSESGWRRSEHTHLNAGQLWATGQMSSWSDFAGGKRSQHRALRGYVEIDGAAAMSAHKSAVSEQATGWDRLRFAHENAASFEEQHREPGTFRFGPSARFFKSLFGR